MAHQSHRSAEDFGKILRSLRQQEGLTQAELAQRVMLKYSTISMYERGQRRPDFATLRALADHFGVRMSDLLGEDTAQEFSPLPVPTRQKPVPIVGTIACGTPILAEENIEGYAHTPENVRADFALRCRGDSMINARIYDGDLVYIREQPDVENGEIAAVLVDGEATLKRVQRYDDHLILQPENPQFRPLVYWGADMADVRILGKAVAFISTVF